MRDVLKRVLILPAVLLIQGCLGGVYGWSAFVPGLRSAHGFTTGQTQLVFGLTIASFTVTMILAGRLLPRWSPRYVGLLSGVLFVAGYLTAALSGGRFVQVLLGIGLVGGASIGFGYVSALSSGVQWFPRHKGLVTGISVAGFGAGAILLSWLVSKLLAEGWSVLEIFRVIGQSYGAVVCAASLFLFRPPTTSGSTGSRVAENLWSDAVFRSLVIGMFCGTFAGLMVVGNLKPIGMNWGLASETATLAISFLAIGNTVGRIAWGWISDRLGYVTIPLSLLFLGVTLALLLVQRLVIAAFSAAAFLVGLGFGACFVLYAAQVAARYGADAVARVYPLVFLAYGVAGITGPPAGGYLFDLTSSYMVPIVLSIGVLIFGAGWTWSVWLRSRRLALAKG